MTVTSASRCSYTICQYMFLWMLNMESELHIVMAGILKALIYSSR
jgi:hypothetical protein